MTSDAPPWNFDIDVADHLDECGVAIAIDGLTQDARISFDNPRFLENLRRAIARDYSLYLNLGLGIILNDKPIDGYPIKLRQSEDFAPMRHRYEISMEGLNGSSDDTVFVEILAGMAASPPETTEPAEDTEADKRYGWYIACNGRMVLAADKTTISGWGRPDWPQWHYQYAGFVGVVPSFTALHRCWD